MLFQRKKKSLKEILPPPFTCSNYLYTLASTEHDSIGKPTATLIDLSLKVIKEATSIDLNDLCKRIPFPPFYPNVWPGEHYKLLAGFVKALNPRLVIEIGTAKGLSALSLKKHLSPQGQIITFDLFSWKNDPGTALQEEDFADGRLVQYLADLSQDDIFASYREKIKEADLIFIDATHDGILEKNLLSKIDSLNIFKTHYIILDDIRMWGMLKLWREISDPKLDLTSFGHWSGTGIIEKNYIPKVH
jgi:predicted O-methyltransferase YrrM